MTALSSVLRSGILAVAAALILGFVAPATADELAETDRSAIHDVISDQLEAFLHDDGAAAFTLAAPMIRDMFGTPEKFMEMVQRGYKPVYRHRQVTFGDLSEVDEDGRATQTVYLVGEDGKSWIALYDVMRQQDGTWRVGGCAILPDDGELGRSI